MLCVLNTAPATLVDMLLTCQAVLFDLDGVLVDSTPCVTRVWSQWALHHGLDPERVVHVAHGKKAIETVRTVAPALDAEHEFHIIEKMELEDTDGLRLLPGAKELLSVIPPERCTVVTSGTRRLATKRLETIGLSVPPTMISADDVSRGKPDPEPYLAGAKALGFRATECLVFEDAPSGIRSAQAAGATPIGVATTYHPEEIAFAHLVIPSLAAVQLRRIDASGLIQLFCTGVHAAAEGSG
jgi:sugar-phosphatase